MATKPAASVEGHILIRCSYDKYLAIPMSLASTILPHIKVVEIERQRNDAGDYVETTLVQDYTDDIRPMSAEKFQAAIVATRLQGATQ